MKKILDWIRKHKVQTLLILITIIFAPIMLIHILFKFSAPNEFLVATWSSGELLGYFGDILTFLGTVTLGYIAVLQSEKANNISENLMKMDLIKSKPCFDFVNAQKYFMTLERPTLELSKLYNSEESMRLELLYTNQPRTGITTDVALAIFEVTNTGHSDIRYVYVKKIKFSLLASDRRNQNEIIPMVMGNTNLKVGETKKLYVKIRREYLDINDFNDPIYKDNIEKIMPSIEMDLHIVTTDGLDFYERIKCGTSWEQNMKSEKNCIERQLVVTNVNVTSEEF